MKMGKNYVTKNEVADSLNYLISIVESMELEIERKQRMQSKDQEKWMGVSEVIEAIS